jgi:hypothetical protein
VAVTVGRDSLADNDAGIADRPRDLKDAEVARRKIAKRVEIEHLAFRVQERVLGVVAHGRRSNNHSGGVGTLPGDTVGRAIISTECSQIGDVEAELRLRSVETDEEEDYCGKTDFAFRLHSDGSSLTDLPTRLPRTPQLGCTFLARTCRG